MTYSEHGVRVSAAVDPETHTSNIIDQFERQTKLFAGAKGLHSGEIISALVDAATPEPDDEALDVACGPGTVAAAFATHVRRAVGVDVTQSMLDEAASLANQRGLENVEWIRADAMELPFASKSFDIVSCRFAFHHMQNPQRVLSEMKRVCRVGGRVVVCDAIASDDPAKAAALNKMERFRDSSTVRFRPLGEMMEYFVAGGMGNPQITRFRLLSERDGLARISFPVDDDREALCRMIDSSVEGDTMGLGAYRDGNTVRFHYPSAILVAKRD